MTKRLVYPLILYIIIGMQISLASPIPGLSWDIDLVLLALVILSSRTGRGEAILWAALAGLALDCFDIPAMGGHIVAKSTAILILGLVHDSMNLEQPALLAATVFVLAIADRLIFRLFSPYGATFIWNFLRFDLPSALLTALVGWVILMLAIRLGIFRPRPQDDYNA